MNIHEHQAKQILKKYGAVVPEGVFALTVKDLVEKAKLLNTKKYVLKAKIHAGGRGKAGGVILVKSINDLEEEAKKMMGKVLVTNQTGQEGKEVKRLYIEEASDISKEFYLSCLIDRETSKIAFISSTEGGMDIEKVALETPNKIITTNFQKIILTFSLIISMLNFYLLFRPHQFSQHQRRLCNSNFFILNPSSA